MKKVIQLLFVLFVYNPLLFAQQDPEFTQYMYNMSIINPAYATNDIGVVNFGMLYRTQWVGSVGSPTTGTVFLRTPINERIEAGFSIVKDEIGDNALNENNISGDFAYLLQINRDTYLSLGLKLGLTLFETRFNDFQLNSGDFSTDPAFDENINDAFLNFGTGLFLFSEDYYLGLSTPNFLATKHLEEDNGVSALGSESLHIFFTGGYVFPLNEDLKFKPSFMAKAVTNSPFSVDLNANFLFRERFEAGLSYRLNDAVSVMANFGITENLRVGYAYDYTTTNLGNYNSGTHEFMLLYNLRFAGVRRYSSPRFF